MPFTVRLTIEDVRREMSGNRERKGLALHLSVIGPSAYVRKAAHLYFAGEECAGSPCGVNAYQSHLHYRPEIQTIFRYHSTQKTIPFLPIHIPSKHLTFYPTAPNLESLFGGDSTKNGRHTTEESVIDYMARVSSARERNPFSRSFASP